MTDSVSSPSPAVSLFDVISRVESNSNSRAVRFEGTMFAHLSNGQSDSQKLLIATIQKLHQCSWTTALCIYCSSYGQVQIMGFNLYGPVCQYTKTIWDYVEDPVAQLWTFQNFISEKKLEFTVAALAAQQSTREAFGAIYNGNGPAYGASIANALRSLGVTVN